MLSCHGSLKSKTCFFAHLFDTDEINNFKKKSEEKGERKKFWVGDKKWTKYDYPISYAPGTNTLNIGQEDKQ